MRRNLIAGTLLAAGIALMAIALPGLGVLHLGSAAAVPTRPIPGVSEPLAPQHQHPGFLAGVTSSPGATNAAPAPNGTSAPNGASSPSLAIAYISIPVLGIKNAPVFDRGVDSKGNMLIARGYAVTHYSYSATIGAGNAVLYGHDDIEGSVFGRLKDLKVGDEVDIIATDGTAASYRVTGRAIVAPTAVQILKPTPDVRLTLFTCWPNWVDTQRVVVTAAPIPAAG